MVELKEKTVEELRKMASKKKIEGRSKMNKAELIRALKKTSSSKKIMKRRKMKGGALNEEQVQSLINRFRVLSGSYNPEPLYLVEVSHLGYGRTMPHSEYNNSNTILRRSDEPIYITIRKITNVYNGYNNGLDIYNYTIKGERNDLNARWRHSDILHGNTRIMSDTRTYAKPKSLYWSEDNRLSKFLILPYKVRVQIDGRKRVLSASEVEALITPKLLMLPSDLPKCSHVSIPLERDSPPEIIESFDNEIREYVDTQV